MRVRSIALAIAVLAGSGVCVRLGFWQLSRLAEKRALNAALARALSAPPVEVTAPGSLPDSLRGRRVVMRGVFDERHQVLLSGRVREGAPGVHVVTPLVPADGSPAVLVDRGWLPSADAATARPQDFPEPGPRRVVGIAEPLPRGAGGRSLRTIEADSVTLVSASLLDQDSLAVRLPVALAPFFVRELPSAAGPSLPAREAPRPYDESMHLSYAVQWFTFAAILLFGPLIVAWRRRTRGDEVLEGSPGR